MRHHVYYTIQIDLDCNELSSTFYLMTNKWDIPGISRQCSIGASRWIRTSVTRHGSSLSNPCCNPSGHEAMEWPRIFDYEYNAYVDSLFQVVSCCFISKPLMDSCSPTSLLMVPKSCLRPCYPRCLSRRTSLLTAGSFTKRSAQFLAQK